jgi:hypothetical protein
VPVGASNPEPSPTSLAHVKSASLLRRLLPLLELFERLHFVIAGIRQEPRHQSGRPALKSSLAEGMRSNALSASVGFYDLCPCSDITVPTAARLSATLPAGNAGGSDRARWNLRAPHPCGRRPLLRQLQDVVPTGVARHRFSADEPDQKRDCRRDPIFSRGRSLSSRG